MSTPFTMWTDLDRKRGEKLILCKQGLKYLYFFFIRNMCVHQCHHIWYSYQQNENGREAAKYCNDTALVSSFSCPKLSWIWRWNHQMSIPRRVPLRNKHFLLPGACLLFLSLLSYTFKVILFYFFPPKYINLVKSLKCCFC